jgi:alpha-tubulin suppressor-like RCC1 family protein
LWGCGRNNYGQQGSGDTTDVTIFTQRLANVQSFYADDNVTWVIKSDNTFWGCGWNESGNQGNGESGSNACVLSFTQRMSNVKEFVCTSKVTWVLKNDNTLWGCGLNNAGQQSNGHYDTYACVSEFTQRLDNVKTVYCTNQNTWAIKNNDTLWSCGNNNRGEHGTGNTSHVTPFAQALTDVKKIVNGGNTTWVIKNDDTLWGCGWNNYGQQGANSTSNIYVFTQRMTDVDMFSCTNEVTWVVKKDKTIWGCGHNDCGQQGDGTTNDVLEFTQRILN